MIKPSKNRGDTIVEVMIAIVVLGAALGGAFAISNRSQLAVQANHERYQAQVLANGQAELLRSSYEKHLLGGPRSTYAASVITGGCIDETSTWRAFTAYCENRLGLYDVRLTLLSNGTAPGEAGSVSGDAITFKIEVVWDSLVSGGDDKVELIYGI